MFCVNCGNNLADGQKFCPNCGTAVNYAVKQPAKRLGADAFYINSKTYITQRGVLLTGMSCFDISVGMALNNGTENGDCVVRAIQVGRKLVKRVLANTECQILVTGRLEDFTIGQKLYHI